MANDHGRYPVTVDVGPHVVEVKNMRACVVINAETNGPA